MTPLDAALAAHGAGLCVLPPREDGSKAPDSRSWTKYQLGRSTEAEIRAWYANGRTGLGVVCGNVSGGLEMLELEGRAVADGIDRQFRELAESAGLGDALTRILAGYSELTPSGGYHLFYRVASPLGNTPLARRPATADELAIDPANRLRVLIETRGEGGYVVTAPSNGRVHPGGEPWTLKSGGFGSIATITDEERDELWRIARALDRMPVEPARQPASVPGDERPGDRYNARPDVQAEIVALLERHGWTRVYSHGERDYMRRPGKRIGISATVGFAGPGVFHVFSSSVAEFEALRSYSPFGVYALLEHGGDYGAAATELARQEGPAAAITIRTTPAPVATPTNAEAAVIEQRAAEPNKGGLLRPRESLVEQLGARSLTDVPADPPAPLTIERLDPEGQTVLYGTGGSYKGTVTAWWIVQLVRAGRRVLVLDYENHPGEWARRVAGLGGDAERAGVVHVAPLTASWGAERGPIWKQADTIRALADAVAADYIVVDSIVIACAGFDPLKPETPALYAGGIELIGRPALSIAHATKAEDLRYPFGSAFWHNLARTTWSLKRDGERAILTHRKRNNYASLGRFVVTTTWRDELPREVWEQPYIEALSDRIAGALVDEALTAAQVAARLNADRTDDEEEVKADSVRKALARGLSERPREAQRFTINGTGATAVYRRVRP